MKSPRLFRAAAALAGAAGFALVTGAPLPALAQSAPTVMYQNNSSISQSNTNLAITSGSCPIGAVAEILAFDDSGHVAQTPSSVPAQSWSGGVSSIQGAVKMYSFTAVLSSVMDTTSTFKFHLSTGDGSYTGEWVLFRCFAAGTGIDGAGDSGHESSANTLTATTGTPAATVQTYFTVAASSGFTSTADPSGYTRDLTWLIGGFGIKSWHKNSTSPAGTPVSATFAPFSGGEIAVSLYNDLTAAGAGTPPHNFMMMRIGHGR